jgi:hypothetical protein
MANDAATITMNMREVDRLKTVQAVVDRMTRVGQAAKRLGLSRRQMSRLMERYAAEGPGRACVAQARTSEQPSAGALAPSCSDDVGFLWRRRTSSVA